MSISQTLLARSVTRLGLGNIEVIMFFSLGAYYAPFVFLGYACMRKSAKISQYYSKENTCHIDGGTDRAGVSRYAH